MNQAAAAMNLQVHRMIARMEEIDPEFRESVAFQVCEVVLMNTEIGTELDVCADFWREAIMLCTLRAELVSFDYGTEISD